MDTTGDQVIKNLSRMLRDRFRTTDAVGRYGGEEFAVVLPNATSDNALEIVESSENSLRKFNTSPTTRMRGSHLVRHSGADGWA